MDNLVGWANTVYIEDAIAYITDTIADQATAEFVKGVNLLMHELWLTDAEADQDEADSARHSNVSGLAHIARAGKPAKLMPVHHRPNRSYDDVCRMAQHVGDLSGIEAIVPQEGEVYPIG